MTHERRPAERPARGARQQRLVGVIAPLTLVCCAATAGGAQGADQRSIAEYDLARDAFQNGRLREALEHVEQALSHDEDNADVCEMTCPTAGDGVCDDGGSRSRRITCAIGTDCDDCGSRPG